MSEHLEIDPLDALRAADPVRDDHLPSASLARIRARILEDVMTTDNVRVRRPARLIGAGAGAIAVGALAFAIVLGGRGVPGSQPGGGGTGSASCIEQYSLATLANRSIAFDGSVSAIDGDRVTFAVNVAFKGASGATITLDAAGMTGSAITSAGGPNLAVGERYLVAGEATFAWACGFTQPYDAAVAADWADALRD